MFNSEAISFEIYDPQVSPSCTFQPYVQSNNCPELLTLFGTIGPGTYQAQEIDLNGSVVNPSEVTLISGNGITVMTNNEFMADQGALLEMKINN